MITEEQIRSGCETWFANKNDRCVHRSNFSSSSVSSKLRIIANDEAYFASREEAEECLLKHLLERLNDN